MAIARSLTGPIPVRAATGICTSASFTAPASALLLANVTVLNTGTATDTIADTGGLVWTKAVHKVGDAVRSNAIMWWAITTSSVARTVSVSPGVSANSRVMHVQVLTGTDLSSPIGATVTGNRTTSGAFTQSLTSTATGSMAWLVYFDGNGLAFPTASAGDTTVNGDNTVECMASMFQTALSASVGATMTIGDTAPNTAQSAWAMAEILPPGRPSPKMITSQYSSFF